MTRSLRRVAIALALAGAAPSAEAVVTAYTSRAAFDAALSGLVTTASADFDALADGTLIPSGGAVGGVTFTYSIDGVQLVVTGAYATTSPPNSLGTESEFVFLAGDAFAMDFPASTAFALCVIGEDMLPGDLRLSTPAGDVVSGAPDGTASDGSDIFFLGVIESDPLLAFTSASLESFPPEGTGDFVWNVDDVYAAPEPGACAAALAALAALSRRAASRRTTARARCACRRGR